MGILESITLDLAGILVTVHADAACLPGLRRLALAWGSCQRESSTKAAQSEIFAREESGQVVVRAGPLIEHGEFEISECHLAIERALYAELARLLPSECQMLHAGAVLRKQRGFLFLGPSGAGKSSLCLEAVRHGALYLTDDLLTTSGQEVFGVARAIQFDPPTFGTPFPSWLAAATLDFDTYGRLSDETDNSVPLFVPGREATIERAPASSFTTVILERGARTILSPITPSEALGELVGASFLRNRPVDLGSLVSRRAFRLAWREPNEAWHELERCTE